MHRRGERRCEAIDSPSPASSGNDEPATHQLPEVPPCGGVRHVQFATQGRRLGRCARHVAQDLEATDTRKRCGSVEHQDAGSVGEFLARRISELLSSEIPLRSRRTPKNRLKPRSQLPAEGLRSIRRARSAVVPGPGTPPLDERHGRQPEQVRRHQMTRHPELAGQFGRRDLVHAAYDRQEPQPRHARDGPCQPHDQLIHWRDSKKDLGVQQLRDNTPPCPSRQLGPPVPVCPTRMAGPSCERRRLRLVG